MSDTDCYGMECDEGHSVAFTKDNHRFSCEDEICKAHITGICPLCHSSLLKENVDDSGQWCASAFCWCSDDYDICLPNRIFAYQTDLGLCFNAPWELDFEGIKEDWDAALERNLITQQEYEDGLKEATEYFDWHEPEDFSMDDNMWNANKGRITAWLEVNASSLPESREVFIEYLLSEGDANPTMRKNWWNSIRNAFRDFHGGTIPPGPRFDDEEGDES